MTTAPPDTAHSGYIPSLDGIRAVAVALVVVAHAGYGDRVPGGLGVTVFFFLSGYLITTLFYRERSKTARIDLPAFYLRRVLRLSPPLLVSLMIGYSLLPLGLAEGGVAAGNVASQVLYFANYYQLYAGHGQQIVEGQWVLWSLAVEEHFYLIYPVFFIFLSTRRTTRGRVTCVVAILVLGALWRVFVELGTRLPEEHLMYATDARLDSIVYGCLLAILAHEGIADRLFPKTSRAAWLHTGVAVGLLLFTLLYRDDTFRRTLRYSLQGIALLPLFHYAVHMPRLPHHRLLNLRPLRAIGVYSYSIYLSHDVIMHSLGGSLGMDTAWLRLLVGGAISVAYGAAMFRLVDRPMLRLRHRIRAPATIPAAPA